ncbi:MAG TPA: winged helix DNA-binding protein [Saprospiraceae bacterium]|nr:winged helix DNA-binding protein [Saprospiraceae bacterium]
MHLDFIRKLLDLVQDYEAGGGKTDAFDREDFISWLMTSRSRLAPKEAAPPTAPPLNGLIAMYLSFMARYARFYSRRVFRDTDIYSEDDWGVLVSLYPHTRLKKTDVIRQCIMEKSSGNEVLKRMLKQGLLLELEHPDDKRAKLIGLTDAGRAAFESVQYGIARLSDTVVADLTVMEKTTLLNILNKLHRYHKPVFETADEEELGRLLGKI